MPKIRKVFIKQELYLVKPLARENRKINTIHFHTATPSRFFPEAKNRDPNLHEVGYALEKDRETDKWLFKRREDFYVNNDLTQGGREHVLSETVTTFELEFLEQEIKLSNGGFKETWVKKWDSLEPQKPVQLQKNIECRPPSNKTLEKPPCLPIALRLKMALTDSAGTEFSETLELNLIEALQR